MFASQNPFDKLLDKATSNDLLETDWSLIMQICDFVNQGDVQPKYALNAIKKKILNNDPHVSLYALQALDACVCNCGKRFHLAVCSREFENDARKILSKGHLTVVNKFKKYLSRWSEQEFKSDPQLSLIPSLYNQLKKEGVYFPSLNEENKKESTHLFSDPNVVTSNQEEEDIAKAIELSLKETTSLKSYSNLYENSSLYPKINSGSNTSTSNNNGCTIYSSNSSKKEPYKVRAIYDFEAAEDNEMTFFTGEIILVLDDSDNNWWKGSNHRGEGLFPCNFVTTNLDLEPEPEIHSKIIEKKSVKFNEDIKIKVVETEMKVEEIEESKIDRLLYLLHEADPTGEKPDSEELLQLEEQCIKMGPLIDQELEKIDKQHASLSSINTQLVDALNIFCSLMKETEYPLPAQSYQIASSVQMPQYSVPNVYQQSNYSSHPQNMVNVLPQPSNQAPPTQMQTSMATAGASIAYNNIYTVPSFNNTSTTYTNSVPYSEINQQRRMYSQQIPQQQASQHPVQSQQLNSEQQNSQLQQINQTQYIQHPMAVPPMQTHQSI